MKYQKRGSVFKSSFSRKTRLFASTQRISESGSSRFPKTRAPVGHASAQDTTRIRKTDKDRTVARDKTQVQKKDRVHQEDHFMFEDGKMYQVKQGVRSEVKSQVRMENGLVVDPDGHYQMKDRERLQLRDGECLDRLGNRYQNQMMFNKHQMDSRMHKNKAKDAQHRMPRKGTRLQPGSGPHHNR